MNTQKQSNAASAHPELAREDGEAPQAIQSGVTAAYGRRFKVKLIAEGMGNFGDANYYTRQALESAAPLFEGKKLMVDHPSRSEEQDRPERSVRDIAGHYDNVRVEEDNGAAGLFADLTVLPGQQFDWVRTILMQSLEYSKTHPGDLVGLSINANGDAEEADLVQFIDSGQAPASAITKLKEALNQGITTINVVNRITSATSCDLVTEAGAGGKPVSLIEQEKNRMKVKSKEAKPAKDAKRPVTIIEADGAKDPKDAKDAPPAKQDGDAQEGDDGEGAGDKEQHDDAEQDKKLIADMMKKFAKAAAGDSDDDSEEAEESEESDAQEGEGAMEAHHDEADMEAAHEAFKHAKAAYGCESEEAAKIACAAVHASKSMQAKKEAQDAAAKESQPDPSKLKPGKKESAKAVAKDSDRVLSLTAENSRLKESLKKIEVERHLDKSLRESGLPMAVTKKFRECVGTPKSVSEIDEKLKLFKEAYQVGGEADGMGFVIAAEKQETTQDGSLNFADCVTE